VKLTVAYTPCPNDTFMFHALATGLVRVPGTEVEAHLHDVQELNRLSLLGAFDVTKVSFYTWLMARDQYELLPCGAALGFACGPLVVAHKDSGPVDPAHARFAVPGELTTAHLLLRLWEPRARNRVFVRYDRVMSAVADGEADFGVVIHEGRFTFERAGLKLVQDLGAWWEARTGLPVPLGCILARKALGRERIDAASRALRESIQAAMARPEQTLDYMRAYAQEMDPAVLQEHVRTFVNDFSLDMGPRGQAAIAKLEEMARAAGVIS
jgi:1,4-dihydroxy-6-naphthoate synthase